MKKSILMLAFFTFLMGNGYSQDSIPKNARDHFTIAYTAATNVEWDIEGDGIDVTFDLNGVKWKGKYDATGNWLLTKRELDKEELPQVVLNGLKKSEFANWDVKERYEYQTPNHRSLYQFEVKWEDQKKIIFLTPEGKLLPEMTKTENQ